MATTLESRDLDDPKRIAAETSHGAPTPIFSNLRQIGPASLWRRAFFRGEANRMRAAAREIGVFNRALRYVLMRN